MKYLRIPSAVVLFLSGLLFVFFTGVIIVDEIVPGMRNGTLTVETSSQILNRVWVGNEIYVLLAIYAIAAACLLLAGATLMRNTPRRRRHKR